MNRLKRMFLSRMQSPRSRRLTVTVPVFVVGCVVAIVLGLALWLILCVGLGAAFIAEMTVETMWLRSQRARS